MLTEVVPSRRSASSPPPGGDLGVPLLLAALVGGCAVAHGWLDAPQPVTEAVGAQLTALLRVAMALVATVTLVLGPGLVLRGRRGRDPLALGLVPVPGILLLAALGGLVWVLPGTVDPHLVGRTGVLALLAGTALLARSAPAPVSAAEVRVLGVAAAVLLVGLGRSLWSLGPEGELYGGTVSRTLEVGDRPDSRISYHVASLVAAGISPYSSGGAALFAPYSFSDRGPVPGMVAAPLMLAFGTSPTTGPPDAPWSLYDPTGFMVYRIALLVLAATALLAVHSVTQAAFGDSAALMAVLVVAGTPFVVHEVYFTWPKLAAAGQCLLAAHAVVRRRPVAAGLLLGLGYLLHPLALLSAPTLMLLVLLVEWREGGPDPLRRLRSGVARCVVTGLCIVAFFGAWRVVNGDHYTQGQNFVGYFRAVGPVSPAPLDLWLEARATSVANTFVPLRVPLVEADSPSVNAVTGPSDAVVHFFFQYWVGLPFGAAIVFYPALLLGLWRVLRRRPFAVLLLGVAPLALFALYWGSSQVGLLREGLHAWVLTVLVLWSAQHAGRSTRALQLSRALRAVLVLRLVEVLAMVAVPTVHAQGGLLGPGSEVSDAVAVGLVLLALAALGTLTVRWTGRPTPRHRA